jgi:hypothetical protein
MLVGRLTRHDRRLVAFASIVLAAAVRPIRVALAWPTLWPALVFLALRA